MPEDKHKPHHSTTNPIKVSPHPKANPILSPVDNLLRLHIIGAKYEKPYKNTFVVITVGNRSARTISHPLIGIGDGSKDVRWEEHFTIEYEKEDESPIRIQVFSESSSDVLGELNMHFGDIDTPRAKSTDDDGRQEDYVQEIWNISRLKEEPLKDKDGLVIGTLIFRLRREFKMHGTLSVDVNEVELENAIYSRVETVKCVLKHFTQGKVNQLYESPVSTGVREDSRTIFKWPQSFNGQFDIDQTNNIYDVFIEVWQGEQIPSTLPSSPSDNNEMVSGPMLGQARLTLFDARSFFNTPLPIYSFSDHKLVGHVKLEATMEREREKHTSA